MSNMSPCKSCINCRHKYSVICILFDELVEDNDCCSFHCFDEERLWSIM